MVQSAEADNLGNLLDTFYRGCAVGSGCPSARFDKGVCDVDSDRGSGVVVTGNYCPRSVTKTS